VKCNVTKSESITAQWKYWPCRNQTEHCHGR